MLGWFDTRLLLLLLKMMQKTRKIVKSAMGMLRRQLVVGIVLEWILMYLWFGFLIHATHRLIAASKALSPDRLPTSASSPSIILKVPCPATKTILVDFG